MPAFEEEIEAAIGRRRHHAAFDQPIRIVTDNGRMVGVECVKMELGEPDDSGRRRPVPIEGSEFVLDLDSLVIAIGKTRTCRT